MAWLLAAGIGLAVTYPIQAADPVGAVGDPLELRVICDPGWELKLKTVGEYMTAAARSVTFNECLDNAINGNQDIYTFQEFHRVGPYVPCDGRSMKDPAQFISKRSDAVDAVRLVAANYNPLEVACTNDQQFTASAPNVFWYDHSKTERVELGFKATDGVPDHQDTWKDFGPGFDYTWLAGYPIDELAGILLHEKLHTHGFQHGTSSANECNYADGFECGILGSSTSGECRANSLLEIAEACMSEVVENSVSWCEDTCSFGETPIYDWGVQNFYGGADTTLKCTCISNLYSPDLSL